MAGQVVYHVTMSLDGFIAGSDDAMDWLFRFDYDGPRPSPAGRESKNVVLFGASLPGQCGDSALLAPKVPIDVGQRRLLAPKVS